MATEQEFSRARMLYTTTDTDDEEEEEEEQEEEESEVELVGGDREDDAEVGEEESSMGCYGSFLSRCGSRTRSPPRWFLGQALDPRAKWVQEWNRVFLLVCAVGLFVDPLFFYALSISDTCMCLFVDGWFAITVTVLRCMTDALHVWNMWLHLKMAKRRPPVEVAGAWDGGGSRSSKADRGGPRSMAAQYFKTRKGFFFDVFVILPLPQVGAHFIKTDLLLLL